MTIPLLVCLAGMTCCILVISINFLTFTKTNRARFKKIIELNFMYFRCALDVLIGLSGAIYLATILLKTLDLSKISISTSYYVVYSSLPMLFTSPIRLSLSIFMASQRILALLAPDLTSQILKNQLNVKLSLYSVCLICLLCGVFELMALLVFCPLKLEVSVGCSAIGCMLNHCFLEYWNWSRMVYFSLTFLATLTYSIVICFCETNPKREKRIVKTDYWLLLCMFISTMFDSVPFAVAEIGIFGTTFLDVGPFITTFNMLGHTLEAMVASRVFENFQDLKD